MLPWITFFALQETQLTPEQRRLVRDLLRTWGAQARAALAILERDGALTDAFWLGVTEEQRAVLQWYLGETVVAGVTAGQQQLARLGVGVTLDWQLVNQDAVAWARQYAGALVNGITDTTAQQLRETIAHWIESAQAFPALRAEVEKLFDNPVRAEMIAVTETTRAIAEGNTRAWQAGGVWGRRWETAVDELVCPVCGGLHRQVRQMDAPFTVALPTRAVTVLNPPAHPRCRCVVFPVIRPERSPSPGTGQERRVVADQERTFNVIAVPDTAARLLIPVDLDRSQQVLDETLLTEIVALGQRLPPRLRDVVQEVIVLDARNTALENLYRGTEYGDVDRIVASASPHNQIIFYPNADLSRAYLIERGTEEIGHLVARRMFGSWSPTDETAWFAAMVADNEAPRGELSNQAEDFAALVGLYLQDNTLARAQFPARVRLLEAWFRAYE